MNKETINLDTLGVELGKELVFDEDNNTLELSSLWKDKTCVLLFVRHFGWPLCIRQVAEISKRESEFEALKSRLVIIGNSSYEYIKPFRENTKYYGLIYVDPSLKTYQILGFKRSIGSLIGLKSFKEAFKSTMSGHFFKGIQGDSLQEGGVIIISTNNKIYYFYQSKEAGDHPLVSNMIKALKSSQEAI